MPTTLLQISANKWKKKQKIAPCGYLLGSRYWVIMCHWWFVCKLRCFSCFHPIWAGVVFMKSPRSFCQLTKFYKPPSRSWFCLLIPDKYPWKRGFGRFSLVGLLFFFQVSKIILNHLLFSSPVVSIERFWLGNLWEMSGSKRLTRPWIDWIVHFFQLDLEFYIGV